MYYLCVKNIQQVLYLQTFNLQTFRDTDKLWDPNVGPRGLFLPLRVHKLNVHPFLGWHGSSPLVLVPAGLAAGRAAVPAPDWDFPLRVRFCVWGGRGCFARPPPQTLRVPTGLPELWQGCQGLGRGFSTSCFQTLKLLVPEAVMGVNPLLGLQRSSQNRSRKGTLYI